MLRPRPKLNNKEVAYYIFPMAMYNLKQMLTYPCMLDTIILGNIIFEVFDAVSCLDVPILYSVTACTLHNLIIGRSWTGQGLDA